MGQTTVEVEDGHGKSIEVIAAGDVRPSAQIDALLDATHQMLANVVMHGGEPVSLHCKTSDTMVEMLVRDHNEGLGMGAILPDRLSICEPIISRIKRRGDTVEIISRTGRGTEVRIYMLIALKAAQDEHR